MLAISQFKEVHTLSCSLLIPPLHRERESIAGAWKRAIAFLIQTFIIQFVSALNYLWFITLIVIATAVSVVRLDQCLFT